MEKNVKSLSRKKKLKMEVGIFKKNTSKGRLIPVTFDVKILRPVKPPDISKFGLIIYVIEKAVIKLQIITESNFLPKVFEKIQFLKLVLCEFTLSPQFVWYTKLKKILSDKFVIYKIKNIKQEKIIKDDS